jgi:hypothetical protein
MDPLQNFTSHVVESLSAFAPDYQPQALYELLASPLKTLSVYRLLELRWAITVGLDTTQPAVEAALMLIDGQIALREIAGDDGWR